MALDPSIPLKAGQGVAAPNPLDTVGKVVGIGNALANNRLIGIQSDTAAQGRAQDANTWIAQQAFALYGMAKDDPRRAWGELENVLLTGIATGRISEQDAQQAKRYLGGTADEQHFRERLFRIGAASLGIPQQAEQAAGSVEMVPTGGTVQPVARPSAMQRMQSPGMGPVALPGAVGTTLDPSAQTALVPVPALGPDGQPERDNTGRPTGRMEIITGAEAARRGGAPHLVPGGGAQFAPGFTGRMPSPAPAGGGVGAGVQPPAPTVRPQPTGSFGAGPSPTETRAAGAQSEQGTAMGGALLSQADTVPTQKATLGEMEAALAQFESGKGRTAMLNFEAWVQSIGGPKIARAFGIDEASIASGQTFQKLAQNIALQQAANMGAGNTDAARHMTFSSNPNLELSKLTNKQIIHMLQGNADAIAAKAEAWRNSPEYRTGDYAGFSTRFNRDFDPRTYHVRYMDREERERMISGMSREDKAQFFRKLQAPRP